MGEFKESNYYKSKKHIENAKNAGVKGNLRIQELKEKSVNEHYDNPKLCKECSAIIPYEKKNEKNFCNSSCSAKFNNRNRIVSEEQKLKTSITLLSKRADYKDNPSLKNKKIKQEKIEHNKVIRLCLNCGEEFIVKRNNRVLSSQKYCCKECSEIGKKANLSRIAKERVANGTHQGWKTRNIISYPEKFFMKVLDNNGIKYSHNYVVKKSDLGVNDSGNYFLDFFIDNKRIDLEIDGKQHFYKERQESDELRDNLLKNNNYLVYRIKWKNPTNDKNREFIKGQIEDFLTFYTQNGV
jgi:predicted RNA-binding Zn-ribbon protein involved in translation (DUF1610 family)